MYHNIEHMAVNRKPISKQIMICLYIELNMSKPLLYKNRLLSISINLIKTFEYLYRKIINSKSN